MLTGGHVADCTAGELLLEQMPQASVLHGDKGYDSNAIRRQIEGRGAMPNIPPKANRRWKNCFSPALYRNRNAIERMFGRLKDFRRIATRYDKLADNFLVGFWVAIISAIGAACRNRSGMTSDAPPMNAAYGRPHAIAWNIGTTASTLLAGPRPNDSAMHTCIECR